MLHAGTIDFCTVVGPVGFFACAPLKARRHFFIFHQKAVKLGAVQSAISRLLPVVLLPKVSLISASG